MSSLKQSEENAYKETPDYINQKCSHGPRAVKHSVTPFSYEETTTSAYKTPAPAISIDLIIIKSFYNVNLSI